jgi:hypothetical protein
VNQNRISTAGFKDKGTKLYKYVRLSQFMSMVETSSIPITKVKSWEDTWEMPITRLIKKSDYDFLRGVPKTCHMIYGQCWSLNPESDAMWRIYSRNHEGVMIGTSVSKLHTLADITNSMLAPVSYYSVLAEGLKEVFVTNPEYNNAAVAVGVSDYVPALVSAFLKRTAFEHEKEMRLVTVRSKECLRRRYSETGNYIKIEFAPTEFLESITIDPRAEDWYVKMIRHYCDKSGFPFAPQKSKLYETEGDLDQT